MTRQCSESEGVAAVIRVVARVAEEAERRRQAVHRRVVDVGGAEDAPRVVVERHDAELAGGISSGQLDSHRRSAARDLAALCRTSHTTITMTGTTSPTRM